MAMYQVDVPAYDAFGETYLVPVVTSLNVAKAVVQARVDFYRQDAEHLKKVAVEWVRSRHGDVIIWSAWIDAKLYDMFRSI